MLFYYSLKKRKEKNPQNSVFPMLFTNCWLIYLTLDIPTSLHILYSVRSASHMVPTNKIFQYSSLTCRSFLLFSCLKFLIQGWCCEEKLEVIVTISLRLKPESNLSAVLSYLMTGMPSCFDFIFLIQ